MKLRNTILVLCVLALLIIGCAQQKTEEEQNQTVNTGGSEVNITIKNSDTTTGNTQDLGKNIPFDKLYVYRSVKQFEYKVTTTAAGQTNTANVLTQVSSDTIGGKDAWLMQADMTTQGTTVTSMTWLDKATYKCLKQKTVMNVAGQKIEQEGKCPEEGPNSAPETAAEMPDLTYLGDEKITVPFGTFTAKKYSLQDVAYWYNEGTPVPLKVAYSSAGASMNMELVKYS